MKSQHKNVETSEKIIDFNPNIILDAMIYSNNMTTIYFRCAFSSGNLIDDLE